MGIIDDIKAKVPSLDRNGDGKVDFHDLKTETSRHGLGDKLEEMKKDITGPDETLTIDDAQHVIGEIGDKLGTPLNDLKDKKAGDHQ